MKDKLSPAVVAIVVVVVVAIVGIVGYKVFFSEGSGGSVEDYRKKYAPNAPPGPLSMKIPPGGNTANQSAPPGPPPGYRQP